MAAIREAKMFCVPLLHLLPIRGLEEDTTDAEDSALLAHGCFPLFFDCTGAIAYSDEVERHQSDATLVL
jgi:hypothetical protein